MIIKDCLVSIEGLETRKYSNEDLKGVLESEQACLTMNANRKYLWSVNSGYLGRRNLSNKLFVTYVPTIH